MTTDPVSAFAIRLKDGTIQQRMDSTNPLLFDHEGSAHSAVRHPIHKGGTVIPVLILDDPPAARKVREAEQRVLAAFENATGGGIYHAEACPVSDGFPGYCVCGVEKLNEAVEALLAARAALEGKP